MTIDLQDQQFLTGAPHSNKKKEDQEEAQNLGIFVGDEP
jgi:hypothetical protein